MKEYEIKEGDIVEIAYTSEFTGEYVNEGKALILWKGFNHQPLIRKLDAKRPIWSIYDNIARIVGHVDIEKYMDDFMENTIALEQEPCWTSVSERLPEKYVKVLVTTKGGDVTIGKLFMGDDWLIYEDEVPVQTDELLAWMPLPEPYKLQESEVSK